ncbi:MAG: cell division protein FtsZ [bacterium]
MVKKLKKPVKKARPKADKGTEAVRKTKIRVIGIGGGGGTIVSEIASQMPKASFVAANTDLQALKTCSKKVIRFPFGQALTHGLGTGMNSEIGREAALAEKDKIKKLLEGQDLCILVACLGGGASSGAAPVFAKISRSLGNLTYGIFTLPFNFEGEKKTEIARDSLKSVKSFLNAVTIIPNERVFQIIDKETPLKGALSVINKNLAEGLGGLIETIYEPGLINIDFADFRTVLEGKGRLTYLNTVEFQNKKDSTKELMAKVLNSPLYPYTIRGAKGVLFNIAGEKNLSLSEVNQISKTISDLVNAEAKIIFGISQSSKYSNTIKTTLLATGCGLKLFPSETKKKRTRKKPKLIERILLQKAVPSAEVEKEPALAPSSAEASTGKEKKEEVVKKSKPKPKKIQPKAVKKPKVEAVKEENSEEKVRKNALQIREEAEEVEKEMLEKEKFWETPAFLRRKT